MTHSRKQDEKGAKRVAHAYARATTCDSLTGSSSSTHRQRLRIVQHTIMDITGQHHRRRACTTGSAGKMWSHSKPTESHVTPQRGSGIMQALEEEESRCTAYCDRYFGRQVAGKRGVEAGHVVNRVRQKHAADGKQPRRKRIRRPICHDGMLRVCSDPPVFPREIDALHRPRLTLVVHLQPKASD